MKIPTTQVESSWGWFFNSNNKYDDVNFVNVDWRTDPLTQPLIIRLFWKYKKNFSDSKNTLKSFMDKITNGKNFRHI